MAAVLPVCHHIKMKFTMNYTRSFIRFLLLLFFHFGKLILCFIIMQATTKTKFCKQLANKLKERGEPLCVVYGEKKKESQEQVVVNRLCLLFTQYTFAIHVNFQQTTMFFYCSLSFLYYVIYVKSRSGLNNVEQQNRGSN